MPGFECRNDCILLLSRLLPGTYIRLEVFTLEIEALAVQKRVSDTEGHFQMFDFGVFEDYDFVGG